MVAMRLRQGCLDALKRRCSDNSPATALNLAIERAVVIDVWRTLFVGNLNK